MFDTDIFHSTSPWISDETRDFLKRFESMAQDAQDAGKPPLFNGETCHTLFGKTYLLPESMVISKHLTWNDPVYRFMQLDRLVEMVKTGYLYFHQVIRWEDRWEIPYRYLQITKQEKNRDLVNADYMYGICWTKEFDTDAMWRIYSKDKNSVCVATTVKQLYDALSLLWATYANLFMAPVQYVDLTPTNINEVINSNEVQYYPQFMYPAFIKRTEFRHENEIRLLLFCAGIGQLQTGSIKFEKEGIQIPLTNTNFINEIILDPRLNDAEEAEQRKKLDGYFEVIKKSELYSVDHIVECLEPIIQKADTYSQKMPTGALSFSPQIADYS